MKPANDYREYDAPLPAKDGRVCINCSKPMSRYNVHEQVCSSCLNKRTGRL